MLVDCLKTHLRPQTVYPMATDDHSFPAQTSCDPAGAEERITFERSCPTIGEHLAVPIYKGQTINSSGRLTTTTRTSTRSPNRQ